MSSHFSANQYESAFNPSTLRNYQVPSQHKKSPSARSGKTEIISNDLGHIIVEGARSSSSPWGSFVGTWETERKPIMLRTRSKLQAQLPNIQYIGKHRNRGTQISTDSIQVEDGVQLPTSAQSSIGEPKNDEVPIQLQPPGSRTESVVLSQFGANGNSALSGGSPRPESRMAEAGTQSPLGYQPPVCASEVPSTNLT